MVIILLVMRSSGETKGLKVETPSPMDLRGVFKLTFFIILMLALVSMVKKWLGDESVVAVSGVGGLFELHSVSIAVSNLFQSQVILHEVAVHALLLAAFGSFVSKMFIVGIFWPKGVRLKVVAALAFASIGLLAHFLVGLWL